MVMWERGGTMIIQTSKEDKIDSFMYICVECENEFLLDEELNKCLLLWPNCHAEIHIKIGKHFN